MISSNLMKVSAGSTRGKKPMEKGENSVAKSNERSMEVPPGEDVLRTKTSSKLELDDLPEEILALIVSKLPMRDAVRTSILSPVWTKAWTYHHNLIFNSDCMLGQYVPPGNRVSRSVLADKFIQNVDSVLQQHSGAGLVEFAVRFYLYGKHAKHLDRWISFALASKAKILNLALEQVLSRAEILNRPPQWAFPWHRWRGYTYIYTFPCSLFNGHNSSCIQVLSLNTVYLKPPRDFHCFSNLRDLLLEEVCGLEDLQCLLSGCRVLRTLTIIRCHGLIDLRMPHPLPQLTHLNVRECWRLEKIELAATNLVYFGYQGPIRPIVLTESLSLCEASILFSTSNDGSPLRWVITDIPTALPHLKTLTYSYTFDLENLKPVGLPRSTGKFVHLRYLKLELCIHIIKPPNELCIHITKPPNADDMLNLVYILGAAPFLETFIFQVVCWSYPSLREVVRRGGLPSCPLGHLKEVEFTGFAGFSEQVELAIYILKFGNVLERMVVDPRNSEVQDAEIAAAREFAHNYLPQEDARKVLTIL